MLHAKLDSTNSTYVNNSTLAIEFFFLLKLATNLASIHTEIPHSHAVVKRAWHEAVIDWRHAQGNNSTAETKDESL